jgi:RNA polymerase sigma-70 factor (ECF subfamily)
METVIAGAFEVWPESGRVTSKESELSRDTDQELTKKVAGGDMAAFEEVYRRHQRLVYGLCLRMTQNATEAEDIAQDVFVHLFRTIGSFRGEAAFTTWLHRLTANRVLMHFRKVKSRRDETTDDGTLPERAEEFVGGPSAGRAQLLDRVALDRALARLPKGYRTVFILHDIEGYEHEEVARIMGCAPGTSKSQLHKARTRMRKLLKGEGGKP